MPTIFEAIGISLDHDVKIHGRSFLSVIRGEQVKELPTWTEASGKAIPDPRDWLTGVRMPPWKYVFAPQNPRIPPRLYHLGEDPQESKNLVDQYPAIVESLRWTFAEIISRDDGHPPLGSPHHPIPRPRGVPSGS